MTSPENYKVVTGGSSTSEDSDDENEREAIHCLEEDLYRESNEENDMLDGFSGVKEKVMEVGESSETSWAEQGHTRDFLFIRISYESPL